MRGTEVFIASQNAFFSVQKVVEFLNNKPAYKEFMFEGKTYSLSEESKANLLDSQPESQNT